MTKTFKIPFAAQGDRVSIPDEVQADGAVSYAQGYGGEYGRDQNEDPTARDIEREKMNGIFHDITEAVGEMQAFGVAQWSSDAQPYPLRALVYHNQKIWQSRLENNREEPETGISWVELKADLTADEVNAYSKEESDIRFQPKGNYALKGESYTKQESDAKYQLAGDYATNATVNEKLDKSAITQSTGQNPSLVMSQKAITDALVHTVSIDTLYPVGIVLWFAQNKNPNSLFRGTSWRYIGEHRTVRLAAASGSDVLSTGGNDSVTLTVGQMPAHDHWFSVNTSNFDYGTKYGTTNTAGEHSHQLWSDRTATLGGDPAGLGKDDFYLGVTGAVHGEGSPGYMTYTGTGYQLISNGGSHDHTVSIGIGSHSHSVSGSSSSAGRGSSFSVANAYVKLMGWYRIA